MTSIRFSVALVGLTLLSGCAVQAQRESTRTAYFSSSDATLGRASESDAALPLQWSRVDPRFRVDVDELAINVANWESTGGRAADTGPLLLQLADALDAVPHADRVGPFRDTAMIRTMAAALDRGVLDGLAQRRVTREALLLVHRQLAADANGAAVPDRRLMRAVADLRQAALGISDSAPDSAVDLGLVTARDAMRAFELSIARGQVVL